MIKLLDIILLEKFSNKENLLEDVIEYVEHFLRDKDNTSFKTKKELLYKKEFSDKTNLLIHIVLLPTKESDESYADGEMGYIFLGISDIIQDGKISISDNALDDILSVLSHELTHISQSINGFLSYSKNKTKNLAASYNKTFKDYYKGRGHYEAGFEQEAKLVQLFTYLKRKNYENALMLLVNNFEYFKPFNFKQVSIKMSFMGINKEWYEFSNFIDKNLSTQIDKLRNISPPSKLFFNIKTLSHQVIPIYIQLKLGTNGVKKIKKFFIDNENNLKKDDDFKFYYLKIKNSLDKL